MTLWQALKERQLMNSKLTGNVQSDPSVEGVRYMHLLRYIGQ